MKVDEAINIYREVKVLPTQCHINWLKENFNPILKGLNARMNINWACGSCVKNNMNMLIGWMDRKNQVKN